MRELNNIFDVKSREDKRKILNKFDISAEDKNKVLNKLSSNDKYAPRYFKIDWEKADEDWKSIIGYDSANEYTLFYKVASSYKIVNPNGVMIVNYPPQKAGVSAIKAFAYHPTGVNVDVPYLSKNILSFEDTIDFLKQFFKFNLSMNGITEIVAEEYYTEIL